MASPLHRCHGFKVNFEGYWYMMTVNELRRAFIDYFRERDHRVVPSSSLIPKDDPTLLFTTAGMVQFKPMFAGTVELEYTRAATVQKCLRTSDLENVGRTKRHMTFFEMLGNFSFGDYFKKEAIEYSWDFSTSVIGFNPDTIWISIYHEDDEAFEIWNKTVGVPAERIVRLGKEDNFWGPAGDSGACGPCSELYLDRGEKYGCGSTDCKPGCDCERFLEYWNLVFNQFHQDTEGNLHPLPKTGIDTGMGLERLATLVQGVDSVFETDEMQTLISFVCRERNLTYEGESIVPINVIIEHARAITFAMSDGVFPSNEGRGYILRRILRRALRFSRQLGIREPFLYRLVDPLISIMGEFYPEITETVKTIRPVIESEEKRFLETLENGMTKIEETLADLKNSGKNIFPGKDAFVLYDTFGFPLEMTVEMANEEGLQVDTREFEEYMETQRQRGKESWKGADLNQEKILDSLASECGETIFTGYEQESGESEIQSLAGENEITESLTEGQPGYLVLKETPFYAESGGQVGDTGEITTSEGSFLVEDTVKRNQTFIHVGRVNRGVFRKGDRVTASIDSVRRNLTRANHTATHLLQAALKHHVGEHVKQAGSLVSPERLRFDFNHFESLTDDQIHGIENEINTRIWEYRPVTTKVMSLQAALNEGALAVFDEKYEDKVRVVSVEGYSKELCGGTHVSNTGEIGLFKILREASPGAGMRRIEAITLKSILDRYRDMESVITHLEETLNTGETDLVRKMEDLVESNRSLEKELTTLKKEQLTSNLDDVLAGAEEKNGVTVVSRVISGAAIDDLRTLSDDIRARRQNSVVLLASPGESKVLLLFAATKKAVEQGVHCGNLVKEIAPMVGGKGGGRPDMAQAGGSDPSSLDNAMNEARKKALEMVTS
jgi:alanyl-tRNA synthetase